MSPALYRQNATLAGTGTVLILKSGELPILTSTLAAPVGPGPWDGWRVDVSTAWGSRSTQHAPTPQGRLMDLKHRHLANRGQGAGAQGPGMGRDSAKGQTCSGVSASTAGRNSKDTGGWGLGSGETHQGMRVGAVIRAGKGPRRGIWGAMEGTAVGSGIPLTIHCRNRPLAKPFGEARGVCGGEGGGR